MSDYTPENLKRWTMPPNYAGEVWPAYYTAGVGQHRDSDALARSNFRVLLARLGGESETVTVARDCPSGARKTRGRIGEHRTEHCEAGSTGVRLRRPGRVGRLAGPHTASPFVRRRGDGGNHQDGGACVNLHVPPVSVFLRSLGL
jgi:hypothetical protein